MFAIFKKRSREFSSGLDELKAKAADLVLRASDLINEVHRVIETLHDEINEANFVIETIQCGSALDR